MKIKFILFIFLTIIFFAGCNLPNDRSADLSSPDSISGISNPSPYPTYPIINTPNPSPDSSSDETDPLPDSSNNDDLQQSNNASEGEQSNIVDIPAHNDPPPSNILEQLAWAGQGGNFNPVFKIDGRYLIVSNLNPQQRVEIYFYRKTQEGCGVFGLAEYVTTAIIQLDDTGSIRLELNGNLKDIYVPLVIDHDTGEIIWDEEYYPLDESFCDSSNSCPGAPPQKLKINMNAYVCTSADSVKMREGPGKNYPAIKSLIPGADVKVVGGPTCADNWSWWQVETESGIVGWMSEGGDSIDPYYLCPLK